MTDTASANGQPPVKPVSIQFAGVGQEDVDALARNLEPVLDEVLAGTDLAIVHRTVSALRARLARPRSRQTFLFVHEELSSVRVACAEHAPELAANETLERLCDEVGEVNFADYRADVDSGHVNRALRILAARAPAAYEAARCALAADAGVEVKAR